MRTASITVISITSKKYHGFKNSEFVYLGVD